MSSPYVGTAGAFSTAQLAELLESGHALLPGLVFDSAEAHRQLSSVLDTAHSSGCERWR